MSYNASLREFLLPLKSNCLLPKEYEKYIIGLTAILRKTWNAATNSEDKRE